MPPLTHPDPQIVERIKGILRNELKLGPNAEIADDAKLIGGPVEFDSIDILLLVSTIEKQFGFKIPSEVIGRTIFENVTTLARFVQSHRDAHQSAVAESLPAADTDWLSRLPHGPEFRFVTTVGEVVPGQSAAGTWLVRGDEVFLKGHFPGRPLVPGVLLTEAMAQVAGLLAGKVAGTPGVLAHVDIRFIAPIAPPAAIELRATDRGAFEGARLCEVQACVGGKVVARGNVALHFA